MDNNKKNIKLCEICEAYASSLCFQCKSYFCESCYKFIHEKKNNSQHIKENVDPYVPIDIKCPDHPLIVNNLFCVNENGKFS